ncbi:MAG: hypothetical protein ACE5Z5_08090 [Candidatus Bathyarchaeia archaeon]
MARRARRLRRGLMIGDVAAEMGRTTELPKEAERFGAERWARRFRQGTAYWEYFYQMWLPYLNWIAVHPDLTEEQKMLATKESIRRMVEGLPNFFSSVVLAGYKFAKTYAVEVPARPAKPAGMTPLLV